jgi:hypothetical protein
VAHARLRLNGRDAGLYVLKEGFDKKFLARHFIAAEGNLYDGGFCQEIDGDLERDEGQGPDDHADLRALRDACQAPDTELRWKQLDQLLDVDAFLAFTALELMTCHWDGYCLNRNNYRLYFDPTSHQAHFFPHGMDQMFGDPGASILEWPGALVAAAVMQNPEWRTRYRQRLRALLPSMVAERRGSIVVVGSRCQVRNRVSGLNGAELSATTCCAALFCVQPLAPSANAPRDVPRKLRRSRVGMGMPRQETAGGSLRLRL